MKVALALSVFIKGIPVFFISIYLSALLTEWGAPGARNERGAMGGFDVQNLPNFNCPFLGIKRTHKEGRGIKVCACVGFVPAAAL